MEKCSLSSNSTRAEIKAELEDLKNNKAWGGKKMYANGRFLRRPFCFKIGSDNKGTWEKEADTLFGGIIFDKLGNVRADMKEIADAILRVRPGMRIK